MRYLLRRLGFYLVAAWAALTINFFLPRLMPGDPATALFARFKGKLAPEAIDALRATFGLNDAPLWSQYLTYLGHVLRGEMGISIAYFPAPVSQVIGTGLGWTVFLAGSAVVLSFAIGSLLGVAAAWWRRGWVDTWLPSALVFLGSLPYFWLAMAALYVFGFQMGAFPLGHAYSDDSVPGWTLAFAADVLRHAALPMGTIVGERFEKLRLWLLENAQESIEFDVFLSRLFGEVLSQPGFGFHNHLDAGTVSANLIESVRKFRWAIGEIMPEKGMIGKEYLQTIDDGLVAAQYLSSWTPALSGVFLAPAYSFLLSNRLVDYQFWVNVGSRGWYERLDQPLTHPYVLSRNWHPGKIWNDLDEVDAGERQLARLVQGLIRRCRKGIFLGICELDEQGYEETGLLIRSLQEVLVQDRVNF